MCMAAGSAAPFAAMARERRFGASLLSGGRNALDVLADFAEEDFAVGARFAFGGPDA